MYINHQILKYLRENIRERFLFISVDCTQIIKKKKTKNDLIKKKISRNIFISANFCQIYVGKENFKE